MKKALLIILTLLSVILLSVIIFMNLNIKLCTKKLIELIKTNNITDSIEYNIDLSLTKSPLEYNVIKTSNINGTYLILDDISELKLNVTSSYEDTTNLIFQKTKDKLFVKDEDVYDKFVEFDETSTILGVQNIKDNLMKALEECSKKYRISIVKNNKLYLKYSYKITDNILNKILKKDSLSLELYIDLKMNLDAIKIDDISLLLNKDFNSEGTNITYTLNDKLNINIENINGMNSNIIFNYKNIVSDLTPIDSIPFSELSNNNEIKKNIISNKTKLELFNLYKDIRKEDNSLDNSLYSNNLVLLKVPTNYTKEKYISSKVKKFKTEDSKLNYSIESFPTKIIMEYIDKEIKKDEDLGIYFNIIKKGIKSIKVNDKEFNYLELSKSYNTSYEDANLSLSELYIWYPLDDETLVINYECEGNIDEDKLKNILDIEVIK